MDNKNVDRRVDSFQFMDLEMSTVYVLDNKNKEILDYTIPEITLEAKIIKLRLSYFDHIMWSNSLEKSRLVKKMMNQYYQARYWADLKGSESWMRLNR